MRTVMIIVGGLLLLGVFLLIGRSLGGGTNQIFLIPGIVAAFIWWKLSSGSAVA